MDTEDVDVLQKKLETLKAEKDQKARDIKDLLNNIEIIQKSIDSIVQLLQIEGIGFDEQFLKDVRQVSISDIAYDYLHASTEKKPLHYMDIFNGLLAAGKPIPGKNPSANLLTHISGDKRFTRVSPGTYGLSEWGLEAPKPKARKTVRRKVAK
jgi:hypothetical protein